MEKVSDLEKTAREYVRFIKKANTGNVTIIKEDGRYEFLINGIACELCGCTKIYGDAFFEDYPDGAIWMCSNCWIEVGFGGSAFPINICSSYEGKWVELFGPEPDDWPFKKPEITWVEWCLRVDEEVVKQSDAAGKLRNNDITFSAYNHFKETGWSFFLIDWLNGLSPEKSVSEHFLREYPHDPHAPF